MGRPADIHTFELPAELTPRLAELAKADGKSVEAFARRIVLDYLEDLEDLADAQSALDEIEAGLDTLVPSERFWSELDAETAQA